LCVINRRQKIHKSNLQSTVRHKLRRTPLEVFNCATSQRVSTTSTLGFPHDTGTLRSVTQPAAKDSIDLARNTLALKPGDRVSGLKVTVAEGAASISGQVELPEDRRAGQIVFYVVPAEKDKADEVLRYFASPVADDGSFTIDHIPPGHYLTLARFTTVENETNTTALRLSSQAAARLKLRREAEAAKSEIELKPCQSIRDHKLPLASN
jgi:hypothetical protein